MVAMIGFPDQEVKKSELADWSTNKIGGLPNLCSMDLMKYPKCILCSNYLFHLVQVYCPLQNSSYHRTLNVFGCTNRACWNKQDSIVVVRSQILEEKPAPVEEKKIIVDDDWGVNDWCNDTNGNHDDGWGSANDIPQCEDAKTVIVVKEETMDVTHITSQVDKLKVNDCYVCPEDTPHFNAYHMYVQAEEHVDNPSAVSNDYEMKLYQEYIEREGSNTSEASKCKSNNQEKYEKTLVKHGDELFHQFRKRVSHYPGQVLRYEWNGKPLLLSSRSQLYPSMTEVPRCSHCQSPRIFELQLMPTLVNHLHTPKVNSPKIEGLEGNSLNCNGDGDVHIEFGCIYVFSCSNACWDGDKLRFEFPVLQPDPDIDILK